MHIHILPLLQRGIVSLKLNLHNTYNASNCSTLTHTHKHSYHIRHLHIVLQAYMHLCTFTHFHMNFHMNLHLLHNLPAFYWCFVHHTKHTHFLKHMQRAAAPFCSVQTSIHICWLKWNRTFGESSLTNTCVRSSAHCVADNFSHVALKSYQVRPVCRQPGK